MFFRPFVVAASAVLSFAIITAANADGKKASIVASKSNVSVKASLRSAPNTDGYDEELVQGIVSASVDGLWDRTDYYWHQGDFPRIIALDRIIVEMDPTFMEPYSTGGWLMESAGDNADAEKFYRLGAANHSDSSYMYYQLGMFYFNTVKNYKAALDTSLTGTSKSDAGINDWRLLAHSYEKNGMLPECADTWKYIIKTFPESGAARNNLARVEGLIAAQQNAQTVPPVAGSPQAPTSPAPNGPVISL